MNGEYDTMPASTPAGTFDGQGLRILIADDHHLVREGLKMAVQQLEERLIPWARPSPPTAPLPALTSSCWTSTCRAAQA